MGFKIRPRSGVIEMLENMITASIRAPMHSGTYPRERKKTPKNQLGRDAESRLSMALEVGVTDKPPKAVHRNS